MNERDKVIKAMGIRKIKDINIDIKIDSFNYPTIFVNVLYKSPEFERDIKIVKGNSKIWGDFKRSELKIVTNVKSKRKGKNHLIKPESQRVYKLVKKGDLTNLKKYWFQRYKIPTSSILQIDKNNNQFKLVGRGCTQGWIIP